jgi:hypothetical protein
MRDSTAPKYFICFINQYLLNKTSEVFENFGSRWLCFYFYLALNGECCDTYYWAVPLAYMRGAVFGYYGQLYR